MKKFLKQPAYKLDIRHFIILIVGILIFILIFNIYSQNKKKQELYAIGIMGISSDIFMAVPYWVANSINIGDKDMSPFGSIYAEVLDKNAYEGGSQGKHVILTLKLNAILDWNGKYYYRNQPLNINQWFNLSLGNVNEKVNLIYLSTKPPKFFRRKLRINIKKDNETTYIADNLEVNDEMVNNKNEVLAKIIGKNTAPAEIKSYSQNGSLVLSKDQNRRDIELTVDISSTQIDGIDYFGLLNKVKIGESINLFFNKAALWEGKITSVKPIESDNLQFPGDS